MDQHTNLSDVCQVLSDQGAHLFPLVNKIPQVKWSNGHLTAPDQLPAFMADQRNFTAYGVDAGRSGLIVVDIDLDLSSDDPSKHKNGFQSVGTETIHRMVDLENPPVVKTPRGGMHIYFRAPEGSKVKKSEGAWQEHVDIRAIGGMAVVPGSKTGSGTYELVSGDLTDIPIIPQWLYDELKPAPREPQQKPVAVVAGSTRGDSFVVRMAQEMGDIQEGGRNKEFYRKLKVLQGKNLIDNYSISLMVAAAEYSGLDRAAIEATLHSALSN